MKCPNCNAELNKNDRFCMICGASVYNEDDPTKYKDDGSSQRRGIKKFVKSNIKPLVVANAITILMSLLLLILPFVFDYYIKSINATLTFLLILLSMLIFILGTIGILGTSLDVSRGEKLKVVDIFKKPFKTSHKILLAFLLLLLYIMSLAFRLSTLIPISLIYKIIVVIIILLFLPSFVTSIIIFLDNKIPKENKSIFVIIPNAFFLSWTHIIEFYAMILSLGGWLIVEMVFFGFFILGLINAWEFWVILSILLMAILYIFFIPYFFGSLVNLYRTWTGEDEFEDSKGLSNNFITFVGGSIVVVIVLITSILSLWLPKSDLGEKILDYIEYDVNKEEINFTVDKTITLNIPKGYMLERGYDENSATIDNDEIRAIYSYNGYRTLEENYKETLEDEKYFDKDICSYNYEEFIININNQTVKAYSKIEDCSNSVKDQIKYDVNMFYPIGNNTLKVSLSSETPIKKTDLEKFIDLK